MANQTIATLNKQVAEESNKKQQWQAISGMLAVYVAYLLLKAGRKAKR